MAAKVHSHAGVASARDPHADDLVTLSQPVTTTVEISDEAKAIIATTMNAHRERALAAEAAIADARAGKIDAVELGNRLRAAIANHPELGHGLLKEMVAERSPALAMQMAQALATLLDDPTLRQETVDALRAGGPEARAVGLMALMGRGEPEALDLAAESFSQDSGDARATAAFVLNNAPGGVTGEVADEALAAARSALNDPNADAHLREEAATMLGRQDASAADVQLLDGLVFSGDQSVRARALAALEASSADRGHVMATFNRVANDPSSPEQLALMAKAYLGAPR